MLQDRNGFLRPEYPRIGCFFLPSSTSVTTQRLPNRKGKCERVSLLSWKRSKTQSAAKKHLCGASSPRQRASHRQGAQRKQECWPGHFGRVQHQITLKKKDGLDDPFEISPSRKGGTSPRSHQSHPVHPARLWEQPQP